MRDFICTEPFNENQQHDLERRQKGESNDTLASEHLEAVKVFKWRKHATFGRDPNYASERDKKLL